MLRRNSEVTVQARKDKIEFTGAKNTEYSEHLCAILHLDEICRYKMPCICHVVFLTQNLCEYEGETVKDKKREGNIRRREAKIVET